jgi:PAS domain S-box-containing protein
MKAQDTRGPDGIRCNSTVTALAAVGRQIARAPGAPETTELIVSSVLGLLPIDRSVFFRVDRSSGSLICVAAAGRGDLNEWVGRTLPPGAGVSGRAIEKRHMVVSRNPLEDPGIRLPEWAAERVRAEGHPSVLALPLLVQERPVGVLTLDAPSGHVFTDEEIRIALAFADQAALALDNNRLHSESQLQQRAAQALAEVSRLLLETLDADLVGQRVADSVRRLLGAVASAVFQLDPHSKDLTVIAVSGAVGPQFQPRLVLPRGVGAVGLALREGRPIVTADVLQDPRVTVTPPVRAALESSSYRAVLAVPLVVGDQAIGALGVGDQAGRVFDDHEVQVARAFADLAALAIDRTRLHREIRRQLGHTQTLLGVSHALASALDLTETMRRVALETTRALDADMTGVYLLDPDGTALRPIAGHRVPQHVVEAFRQVPIPASQHPFVEEAFEQRRAVWSSDVAGDPRIDPSALAHFPHRAVLFAPMFVNDVPAGGICSVWWQAPHASSSEELGLVEGIARQASLALARARLYEEAVQRRREAEIVAEISGTINASFDLDVILQHVAEGARDLCRSDRAMVALREPELDTVIIRYHAGTGTEPFTNRRIEPGKGVGGQVLLTGRPFRTDDYEHDTRITKEYLNWSEPYRSRASMAVPIRIGDCIEGLLYAHNLVARPFTDHDEAILCWLADHAATAIHKAQLFAKERTARAAVEASEASFRLLFHNNPLPMWVYDLESLHFLEVNTAAIDHYGYSRDEFLRMRITDIRPPEEVERLLRGVEELRGSEARLRIAGLWRHRTKDGRTIDVEAAAHRLDFGERPAVLVVAGDVTERRTLEEQLRQAQKMEAIGQLAGGVAHDFNNVLTVIKGRAELLRRRVSTGTPAHRDVELIARSVERAAGLTRQLLTFSRKQVVTPRVLDINALVVGLQPMLERLIRADIVLSVETGAARGHVQADPTQLEQVLMNLVVNASDAMSGGGSLTITTANAEVGETAVSHRGARPAGHYVLLAVRDTGCGMDAETRARIFEPFFTTKERGKGTGLGLSTVYGIVQQSDGFIEVESEVGSGSTFRIHLPRVDAPVKTEDGARNEVDDPCRGTETILLVEDEAEVRELACEILRDAGYSVLSTGDPAEALEISRDHRGAIDLLLTDVMMPKMTGLELARQLSPARPATKVLYMSGYTDTAIAQHGPIPAATSLLQKPFAPDSLTRTVREVLDGAEAERSAEADSLGRARAC